MNSSVDRKKYQCEKIKKHVWVLGYFGGGSINISNIMKMAEQFSHETGIDINTISVSEVISSRRFKYFKYITSDVIDQTSISDSIIVDNVYEWLFD